MNLNFIQQRQIWREYQRCTGSDITSAHAHITNGGRIEFGGVDGHDGVAGADGELANHEECNLQPELVIIALGNGRTTAGDARAEKCGTEEPLFADLCDDVHGDGNGGDFDQAS